MSLSLRKFGLPFSTRPPALGTVSQGPIQHCYGSGVHKSRWYQKSGLSSRSGDHSEFGKTTCCGFCPWCTFPGMENCQVDLLDHKRLDPRDWPLYQEVFHHLCFRWETPDIDLMACRLNYKLDRFMFRYRDPQAFRVIALITLWNQLNLIYVLPLHAFFCRLHEFHFGQKAFFS